MVLQRAVRQHMRIAYKMPLAIAGILAVYLIVMAVVQITFIQPRFDELERASALRNLDRVIAALNREALHLAVLDRDWGSWDDTYEFMASGAPSYISNNLSPDSLKSSRVDLVALYDTRGVRRFEALYDWTHGSAVSANLLPAHAPAGSPLQHTATQTDDASGFMDTPGGVFVVASTPILRTDGSGPTRGSFIMARIIDAAFERTVAEQTSVGLKLSAVRDMARSEMDQIAAAGGRFVRSVGREPVNHAYGIVRDLEGSPVLVVEADTVRSTSAWARETSRLANIVVYAMGLGLFLLLFFLMRRLVVRPLGALQQYVIRFESDDHASVPLSVAARRDEIGSLGNAFAHMGATLAARQKELSKFNDTLEALVEERTGELHRTNEDLRLMGKVIESTAEAVVITDLDGKILQVNPAFCRTSGYSMSELIGQNPRMLRSGRHEPSFYKEMWQRLTGAGSWSGEIWDRRKTGELYPKWLTINLIRDEAGNPAFYVGLSSDITDFKETEERLHQLAYFDPLTGLPNRSLFHDRLERSILSGQRYGARVALLFLDLDHFKYVNDAMGHSAGDILLAEVGRRIAGTVRKADTVCRIGGDEFTVILEQISRSEDAGAIAQKIIGVLGKPFSINGQEVLVGASIGIAVYPYDDPTAEGLTRMADAAMYRAKSAGRNSYRFVSGQTDTANQARLAMVSDLRHAIDRGELLLHYQPMVSIDGSRVLGAEALARWRRVGNDQLVPPGEFIPLAEETGLILPLGSWALLDACRTAASWPAGGLPLLVSVNVSPRQFAKPDLIREVREVLTESGLLPERLVIEITESTVMADAASAEKAIKELKDIGVKIAIDDFGTGYSSLSYLGRFPVDRLKIDQSFVRKIGSAPHADAIVTAIIAMASSLGLETVAEGVETEAERRFLEEHGCREAQGYLFSRPVPVESFLDYALTRTRGG